KLFFCQNDHESAEFCARLAGTIDAVKRTTQMVDEGVFGRTAKSGVYSDREVKEFLAHPHKLKRLPTGRALLIKSTEEGAIIEAAYRPTRPQGAFAPTQSQMAPRRSRLAWPRSRSAQPPGPH